MIGAPRKLRVKRSISLSWVHTPATVIFHDGLIDSYTVKRSGVSLLQRYMSTV